MSLYEDILLSMMDIDLRQITKSIRRRNKKELGFISKKMKKLCRIAAEQRDNIVIEVVKNNK